MGPTTTAGARWPDSQLDAMRQVQDAPADAVISELFAQGKVDSVNRLMRTLVENDALAPEALPPVVRDYLQRSERLPDWADPRKIEAGERVFWRYGPAIIAILHCYSLPFCYAGRKGVQVLALTSRLYSNPTRRVVETAQMVVDVMRPGGLGSLGTGVRTAQKVRLMHAGVRFQVSSYAGWNGAAFDLPINQEDMAGTLLSFSYITLDGLRRLGYALTDEEIEAYLHCWNVIGHILGVRPEMLATDANDAAALIARISERQFAACDEGRMMARALIDMMRHEVPGNLFDRAPELLMRYLLGDRTADILGVPAGAIAELCSGPLRLLVRMGSDLMHHSSELMRIHERFGRALIEGILLVGRGGARVPFTIPAELLQTWGVNWLPG
jgi:hypothetical protein